MLTYHFILTICDNSQTTRYNNPFHGGKIDNGGFKPHLITLQPNYQTSPPYALLSYMLISSGNSRIL